jgi:hypothetical protein
MLSVKFIVVVLVAIVIIFGLAFFPSFNTMYRTIDVSGMSVEMRGIQTMFPYFLVFVIFYAGYIVWRKGKQ